MGQEMAQTVLLRKKYGRPIQLLWPKIDSYRWQTWGQMVKCSTPTHLFSKQLPQRTAKTSRCGALWFLTEKARQARLAAILKFMKGFEMSSGQRCFSYLKLTDL